MATSDATALITFPDLVSDLKITGRPTAGAAYLRDGVPVAEIVLGEDMGRTGGGAPRLTVLSVAAMDELVLAVQLARSRLAMWSPSSDGQCTEGDSPPADGAK